MQSKIYLIKTLKAGRQNTAWRHIMKVDKSNNFLQQSTCWTKLISKLQEKVVIFLGEAADIDGGHGEDSLVHCGRDTQSW